MSEPTLVVHQGSLEALEAAMTQAQQSLGAEVTAVREQVRSILWDWSTSTASRQAQLEFDANLQKDVDAIAATLLHVQAALAEFRENARRAEVDNVAILD